MTEQTHHKVGMMNPAGSTKVSASHLQRDTYVYVRQSTFHQVQQNQESTHRQYALQQRAVALGWPMERVHVIDCDLGQSGASAADREGFQQLVMEVSLGRAGMVMGLEVSRLARNSADWQRLLELCALTDTLILDEDGLYDCNDFNDRLLLGLKGTLSEAELHFLKARLRGGILNKARRGELVTPLPVGLVYDGAKRVRLDPDQQAQKAVRFLFSTYRRTGSAHATVTTFRKERLQFPRRLRTGIRKGELAWGELYLSRVLQVLHNPRYAGAFFFGRSRTRLWPDGSRHVQSLPRDEWLVLIPNHHEGYISWDEFEDNQRRLHKTAQSYGKDRRKSPPREGPALLQGLAICGVCGRRMTVRYHSRQGSLIPDYVCQVEFIHHGGPRCQHIPGGSIDAAIADLILTTMTPISLEMAMAVQQELMARQNEAKALRFQQVSRAQYEADLAGQRYRKVDPNNRLVADTLEAEWNAALRSLQEAQQDFQRYEQTDGMRIDEEIRAKIMALTTDFPRVWHDEQTTARDRKRLLRLLLDDVTLFKTHKLTLKVRLRGGATQTLTLPLPLTSWQMRQTAPEVVQAIDDLLNEYTDRQIAIIFNERGLRSGQGGSFRARTVARVRRNYGLKSRYERLRTAGMLTVEEMASQLNVCRDTVTIWRKAGLLRGHPYNKNRYLYEPPGENAPKKSQGEKLSERRRFPETQFMPDRTDEVQYEA